MLDKACTPNAWPGCIFTAAPGQVSAFVPLHLNSMIAAAAQEDAEPTLLVSDSRVVVVGAQPWWKPHPARGPARGDPLRQAQHHLRHCYSTNLVNGGTWRPPGHRLWVDHEQPHSIPHPQPPAPTCLLPRQTAIGGGRLTPPSFTMGLGCSSFPGWPGRVACERPWL